MTSGGGVLRDELDDLLTREPFEPFRIKLLNGEWHDIFDPQNVGVLDFDVYYAPADQNWFIFPIEKILVLESLIADYHGHAQP